MHAESREHAAEVIRKLNEESFTLMFNLRWLFGNFADPAFALSRADQKRVTTLAHERYLRPYVLRAMTIALVIGSIVMVRWGAKPLASLVSGQTPPDSLSFTIAMVLIMVISIVGSAWMFRFIYRRPVRRAMRDLGYDLCIACGYRLEGLHQPQRCPECGELMDHADQPHQSHQSHQPLQPYQGE